MTDVSFPPSWCRSSSHGWLCLLAALLVTAPGWRAGAGKPPAPKTVHIQNARSIRVVLAKTREQAAGVRPDKEGKEGWKVVMGKELDGSTADLTDVTPNIQGHRYSLTVADGAILLDPGRFLPTHVYRVMLVKERQIVGTALLYLYAPPTPPKKSRLDFADGADGTDGAGSSAPITPSPKGGL